MVGLLRTVRLVKVHIQDTKIYLVFVHSHIYADTIKRNNGDIIRILEEEEMEKGAESLFKEITTKNFPNLGRDLNIQGHKTHT